MSWNVHNSHTNGSFRMLCVCEGVESINIDLENKVIRKRQKLYAIIGLEVFP